MNRNKTSYNDEAVDHIIQEVDKAVDQGRFTVTYPRKGRPSLNGEATASPIIGFRIPPDLRLRAQDIANKEGLSLSELARKALQQYLQQT